MKLGRRVKIFSALSCVLIAVLFQLETPEKEILICTKSAVLDKGRYELFKYISNLTEYDKWFPAQIKFEELDGQVIGIGKRYKELSSVLPFGLVETHYQTTITGYDSPKYFEFISDSPMLPKYTFEFELMKSKRTRVHISWVHETKKLLDEAHAMGHWPHSREEKWDNLEECCLSRHVQQVYKLVNRHSTTLFNNPPETPPIAVGLPTALARLEFPSRIAKMEIMGADRSQPRIGASQKKKAIQKCMELEV